MQSRKIVGRGGGKLGKNAGEGDLEAESLWGGRGKELGHFGAKLH